MDRIDEAFDQVKRADFLPDEVKGLAFIDAAVPIGFGQTNSQPYTVELMLRWLDPQPGDRVLDVGSGSGWTTALLAYLVGESGKVFAVEAIPELVKFGEGNCRRKDIGNVQFYSAGKQYGLPKHAPFDRILVSASANTIPGELLEQLNDPGRIVIPVNTTVHVVDKVDDEYETTEHAGFVFVPLV
jgi:protein-L-isoaspartate(D-aspartate) O-methyltransferase